jgi:cytochrome c553
VNVARHQVSAIGRLALCSGACFVCVVCVVLAQPPVSDSGAQVSAAERLRSVLQMAADRERGSHLFTICAACHGREGGGRPDGWPPAIAGQHRRFIAKELVDFRAGVRWYDPMQRIAGPHVLHTTQDLADVSAYVSGLAPSTSTATGSGRWFERGAALYVSRCRSCHGAGGEGDDLELVPRVAGQQFEYLLRRLQEATAAPNSNMPPQHLHLMQGLVAEDLLGLADYMSRLGRGTQGTAMGN